MRGYESYRFHDKAVLYGAIEYRNTFKYKPFDGRYWADKFKFEWLQLVPYFEIGQVAPEYNLKDLTSKMKMDAGLSLRVFAAGLIVRLEVAASDEGNKLVGDGEPAILNRLLQDPVLFALKTLPLSVINTK